MLKAVIFDMDGVIIDSEPIHMEANRRLMKRLGLNFSLEYYKQFIGSTTEHMWQKMISDYNLKQTPEELMRISDDYVSEINGIDGYPVMDGVKELIEKLHDSGILLAVASSSGIMRINNVINVMQVTECFDAIVSGIDVRYPKPAPDTFLEAAAKLNVKPSECIVIEDSLNGVKAAGNAGMVCVKYENINPHLVETQDISDKEFGEIKEFFMETSSYGEDYIVQSFENLDIEFFEMVYSHACDEP